jgi:hypothetical protein
MAAPLPAPTGNDFSSFWLAMLNTATAVLPASFIGKYASEPSGETATPPTVAALGKPICLTRVRAFRSSRANCPEYSANTPVALKVTAAYAPSEVMATPWGCFTPEGMEMVWMAWVDVSNIMNSLARM